MLSYSEALNIINQSFKSLNKIIIEVDLLESVNYILAEDVYSDINMPPCDNSAVDGYGVNFDSEAKQWKLIGEESAGNYIEYTVEKNTTVSIMTGAQVPKSCTSVIMLEDIDLVDNIVSLKEGITIRNGMNIRRCGENIRKGELAVAKDTIINSHKISLLAACGKAKVKVYKPLKVGVFTTGDELVDVSETPIGDKIRATNLYSILSLLKNYHFTTVNLGLCEDNKEKIKTIINKALHSDIDILLTTGGVSVGKYDYLKPVFEELGVDKLFWRAYIKPGKPIYFGTYNKSEKPKLVFGLAGNPVSSFVNFYVYLLPAFENCYGVALTEKFYAILSSSIKKKDAKRHFIRGEFQFEAAKNCFTVNKLGSQSSGNMIGLSNANCLIIFEEEKQILEKGETVQCIRI